MPTITYSDVNSALGALGALSGERLPMATALHIRRGLRLLDPLWQDNEAERLKLVEMYADRDSDGKKLFDVMENGGISYRIAPKHRETFNEQLKELRGQTVEVDWSIKLSELSRLAEIAGAVLFSLGDLLIEDEEPEKASRKKGKR